MKFEVYKVTFFKPNGRKSVHDNVWVQPQNIIEYFDNWARDLEKAEGYPPYSFTFTYTFIKEVTGNENY